MVSYYTCNECGHEWHNDDNVEDDYCPDCESNDIEYSTHNDNEGLSLDDA